MPDHTKQKTDTVLIASKLLTPQLRSNIIHRKRLNKKLDSSLKKLTLVAAPAGFGKTTLIADWLIKNSCKHSWLSLDEKDNDPKRFITYFTAAFQKIDQSIGKKILPLTLEASIPPLDSLITFILNELNRTNDKVMIVLDDYHYIEHQQIHQALTYFIENLPPNVHLIILTRVDPFLPLPRLRVENQLLEIREKDLRFTTDEASEFFKLTMNLDISKKNIEALESRTEGWIAGLQMAAVSLQDSKEVEKFVKSFTGSNRYIVDYLIEEVLNRQSEEVQNFLLRTSILQRFNAGLCHALTGQKNIQKIIGELERANLFLIPLDNNRQWYRYHQLFSELLNYRLRQLYPDQINELHNRASNWYEKHKYINEAIEHAFKLDNYERVLQLMDNYSFIFLTRSELALFLNYIKRIPQEEQKRYPMLLVSLAWAQLMSHQTQELEETLKLTTKSIISPPKEYTKSQIDTVKGQIQTIKAFILRLQGNLTEALVESNNGLKNIGSDQPMVRGLLRFNMGRIYMKLGWAELAIELLHQCIDDSRRAGNHYVVLSTFGHIGFLYGITENLHKAKAELQKSLTYAERESLDGLPACGYILYQFGKVLYQLNEIDKAEQLLLRAVTLGEIGNEPDVLCNALIYLAWINSDRGNQDKAVELLKRAEEIELQSPVKVFESDPRLYRIFFALIQKDNDTINKWVDDYKFKKNAEFDIILEAEILLLIRFYIERKNYKSAERFIDWLWKEAHLRARKSTLGILNIYKCLIAYRTENFKDAFIYFKKCIEFHTERGWTRVFLNLGNQMKEILQYYCQQKNISPQLKSNMLSLLKQFGEEIEPVKTVPKFIQPLTEPLTEREQEVLHYIAKGLSNKEIADKMFVSLNTVKTHIKNLYSKLGTGTREKAIEYGIKSELIKE